MALARLSITGSTSTFPILNPPLARLTNGGEQPLIHTDLWVGSRTTVWYNDPGSSSMRVVGYQPLNMTPLTFYSRYPNDNRDDPNSNFYSVYSMQDVVDSLNAAFQACLSQETATASDSPDYPKAPAQTIAYVDGLPSSPAFFPFQPSANGDATLLTAFDPNAATVERGIPVLNFRMESDYKLTIEAPFGHSAAGGTDGTLPAGPAPLQNPFVVPSKSPSAEVPSGFYFTANLFFNDKLLQLLPMPRIPTVPIFLKTTTADGLGIGNEYATFSPFAPGAPLTYMPTQTPVFNSDNMIGTPNSPAVYTGGQVLPWNQFTVQYGKNMYPLQLPPRSAKVVSDPVTFKMALADVDPPFMVQLQPFGLQKLAWTQEYDVQSLWSVYTGMALTSQNIPAYEEAFGFNQLNNENTVNTASAQAKSVIFDFDLEQDSLHQIQGGISFVPTQFRYAKLKPGQLNSVDLQILLRRRDGTFVPWLLDAGGTISLKLMFTEIPY